MQFSSLFIILFGILTFHIVCEAEIPNNTNSGSQLKSNSSDGSDVEAVDFKEDEIRRVRNTWILATEDSPLDFGEDILFRMTELRQVYNDIVYKYTHVLKKYKTREQFLERQSTMVVQTINNVVNNLSSMHLVIDWLINLGKFHNKLGVLKEYFEDFKHATLYSLNRHLRGGMTPEDKQAWTKVLEVMLSHIFQGYDEEFSSE